MVVETTVNGEAGVAFLGSRPVQIQAASLPGDTNSGPHVELFALCEDGSIWVQYHSSGFSNVPVDGKWRAVQPPAGFRYGKVEEGVA